MKRDSEMGSELLSKEDSTREKRKILRDPNEKTFVSSYKDMKPEPNRR